MSRTVSPGKAVLAGPGPAACRAAAPSAVHCAYCRGMGLAPSADGVLGPCAACGGRGHVWLLVEVFVCVYCLGKGIHPPRSRLTCPVCGGIGRLAASSHAAACAACQGTGRANPQRGGLVGDLRCVRCSGTGLVDQTEVVLQ